MQPLVKGLVAVSNNRADDHVRTCLLDRLHGSADVGTPEEDIRLADAFGTQSFELIFDNLVYTMWPYVVRANQKKLPCLETLIAPAHGRNHLLVWGSTRVNNIGRLLQTFISHWINQQMISSLDDWLHALTTGGGPAPKNYAHSLLID